MTTNVQGATGARWQTARPWLGTAARMLLAAVWLAAGAAKVGDLAASGRAVHAYQLTPYEVSEVLGGRCRSSSCCWVGCCWSDWPPGWSPESPRCC